jgi:membrane-bound serine protease (ClpP class)
MRRWTVSEPGRRRAPWRVLLIGVLLAGVGGFPRLAAAQEAPQPDGVKADAKDRAGPIGQFLSISGTVDDVVHGRISRAALALQTRALQEKRRGVLVLEVAPGSSPFHQIHGLAKFLTTEIPSLTTVAWIPQSVTGNHVILALACQEIVMDPEAALGDIALGGPMDQDEQSIVINLVNRRHNRKVNEALVLGMLNRQKEVLWVQLELGVKPNTSRETRVVSRAGYDDLARSGAQILDVKTIKEAGAPGVFTGARARGYNVLVMHTAETRGEVGTLYQLPREAMREDHTAGAAPRTMIIRIDDVIEPLLEHFVLRQIDRAVGSEVNLLIFEIESPGGYLMSSLNLANAIADLHDKKVRTAAFIPKQALSGAAIIALGCDEIYLTAGGLIGDAGPIEMREGQQFERAPEKVLSVLREALKTLAERKNRPPALAMAMADKDLAVFEVTNRESGQVSFMTEDEIHLGNGLWTKGRQVPESGGDKLLTLDGARAHAVHLAEPPVKDFPDLKTRLGVPPNVEVAVSARTWVDTLIFVLNDPFATTLLFLIGIMCIYFELHFPTGFFGILACVCFGLFFWSRFLGGTAGWLEVVLFLLGVGCLALELFVVPGFGVFGVSGVVLCLFSLILASQTFTFPASTEEMSTLARSVGTLSGAVAGAVVLAALVSRYLPSIPLFNEMILTPPGAEASLGEPRLYPELAGTALANPLLERDRALIGKQGTSTTVLRPAGKARFGDDLIDVISEGPFISAGRSVEVVEVAGNRVVVRELS